VPESKLTLAAWRPTTQDRSTSKVIIKELTTEMQDLIDCYQMVFGGPPWNETWEREDVLKLIKEHGMRWWVVVDGGVAVIGFIAGMIADKHHLGSKLGVPADALPDGDIALLADIGVFRSFREYGIGGRLAERWSNWCAHAPTKLLRCKPDAVTYPWFQRLGFQVIYEYPGDDQRVLMTKS